MKNLKMFAIAVMAFVVMAMGVHAECGEEGNVTLKLNGVEHKCATIKDAVDKVSTYNSEHEDSKVTEVTLTLTDDTTDSDAVVIPEGVKVTLDLDKYTATVNGTTNDVSSTSAGIVVSKNATLIVEGKTGQEESGKKYEATVTNGETDTNIFILKVVLNIMTDK